MKTFTCLFAFCGLGSGARGFIDAQVELRGEQLRFVSLGGIDNDPLACADFEYLTKSPALCTDVATLTPAELREFAGGKAPDCVFLSAPCRGFSALLSTKASKHPRYAAMNRLSLDWIELMLSTWDVPPKLVLFENVPRIASRGKALLVKIKKLLKAAGYVFHEQSHDCGELGGLAQHRMRFLLVARHPGQCAPLLYQPNPRRVRACGEVLGELPLPEDPGAGPMHKLPRLSWLNWVRLSLIPAGGDWRDLDGVLESGQPRREVFRRHHVGKWTEPIATIAGSGSNGPSAIADPVLRPQAGNDNLHHGKYKVRDWTEPAGTVIGATRVGSGAQSVADPRIARDLGPNAHNNIDHVLAWDAAAKTVTGATRPGSGAPSVADPRTGRMGFLSFEERAKTNSGESVPSNGAFSVADPRVPEREWHNGALGVKGWSQPMGTVTGAAAPARGVFSVADPRTRGNVNRVTTWGAPVGTITRSPAPSSGGGAVADPRVIFDSDAKGMLRVKAAFDHGYGVLRNDEPSPKVAGGTAVGQGAYALADLRFGSRYYAGTYGVLSWQEASATITGNARIDTGAFAVADPRKPPAKLFMIIAADGTWHRPLTTLELAALQGLPMQVDGEPLLLAGTSTSAWRSRIGNAVPAPTARAIAEQMLVCLGQGAAGAWSLSSGGLVWVERAEAMLQ